MDEQLRFDGRVAVVTGAGRGIGREIALLLAQRGAHLVVANRSPAAAHDVVAEIEAAGGSAVASTGDLALGPEVARQPIDAAVRSFGRIDVLVNNAGGIDDMDGNRPFAEYAAGDRDALMRQNYTSTWDVTSAAWPLMLERGYGRIVMTTSPVALFGMATHSHYGPPKGGVVSLTKVLSHEGADHGVTVNAISPIALTRSSSDLDDQTRAMMEKLVPPSAIAVPVAWLAHESCTVNGEIFSTVGRHVSRVFLGASQGYVCDATNFTPEAVRDHWDEVMRTDDFAVHASAADAFGFAAGQMTDG